MITMRVLIVKIRVLTNNTFKFKVVVNDGDICTFVCWLEANVSCLQPWTGM